jgi:hypothetical protein
MRSAENIQCDEFGGTKEEKDNWFSKGLIYYSIAC